MNLILHVYVAEKKREIFDRLVKGEPPATGEFDAGVWGEVKDKGSPQMGTTTYKPSSISVEFIYRDALGANQVLKVELESPERIVFMPVPEWVHQTVWQGEVDGTFRFESEAMALYQELGLELKPEKNLAWFEKRLPTTRE